MRSSYPLPFAQPPPRWRLPAPLRLQSAWGPSLQCTAVRSAIRESDRARLIAGGCAEADQDGLGPKPPLQAAVTSLLCYDWSLQHIDLQRGALRPWAVSTDLWRSPWSPWWPLRRLVVAADPVDKH